MMLVLERPESNFSPKSFLEWSKSCFLVIDLSLLLVTFPFKASATSHAKTSTSANSTFTAMAHI